MRIDGRKVNGRITNEPGDIVYGLQILMESNGPMWISGFNTNNAAITISNATVASYLKTALKTAPATPQSLNFIVMRFNVLGGIIAVYPERPYSVSKDRSTIFIDVNDIVVGKKLKITVLTGAIELVSNE